MRTGLVLSFRGQPDFRLLPIGSSCKFAKLIYLGHSPEHGHVREAVERRGSPHEVGGVAHGQRPRCTRGNGPIQRGANGDRSNVEVWGALARDHKGHEGVIAGLCSLHVARFLGEEDAFGRDPEPVKGAEGGRGRQGEEPVCVGLHKGLGV
jgi:hypothetical protein